ncbi:SAVED domain-containing protein [Aneurinibacillus uraniidurans]|uniref:SAVED domain-containing protein n=1 Tax=Aneurinibacillus uraniidurans TaxID=2966586 RepID=UPI002349E68C|nr:SAVED domain-containing protein [Aneurinibacillus sp. B1]WCN36487.1 SAVED domain-containing protein [Aneurinibacillus sp. B1]
MNISYELALTIIFFILLIGGIFFVKHMINMQSEQAVADFIMTVGIELIVTSFGTFDDKVFAFLSHNEVQNNLVQLGTGGVLFLIGLFLMFHVKNKMYIMNINGMFHQRKIENHHKDVGMNSFQFKEKEIDFVRQYGRGVNEHISNDIVEEIEQKVNAFKMESKDKKRGYTGVASIPFVMMAGKFFERERMDEYFEYNKFEQTYYQLIKKPFRKSYPQLTTQVQDPFASIDASTCDEVVVAISLTAQISDEQLSQFNCPCIHLAVSGSTDNLIIYKEQLQEYVNTAYNLLMKVDRKLPKLQNIHLVISGQSCFAFELGKLIDDNRMKAIVNYQYNVQSTPKYPWGIVLNGQRKGQFILFG